MKFMILIDFECSEVVLFQELWVEFIVWSVYLSPWHTYQISILKWYYNFDTHGLVLWYHYWCWLLILMHSPVHQSKLASIDLGMTHDELWGENSFRKVCQLLIFDVMSIWWTQNEGRVEMSMTTPVVTQKGESGGEKMDMTTPVIQQVCVTRIGGSS